MADSERYEVLGKIGQGSFGVINKVRRKSDGLILCRKEICYSKMSQKEKEQLQAELSILKELKHPNIVQYFERDHIKNTQDLHLYMEYCGNGDLGQVIKRYKNKNERPPEGFIWSIFSQLVTALYKCHKGVDPPEITDSWYGLEETKSRVTLKTKVGQTKYCVLHRDLKPENVFLDGDNNVKLGDFGLSKIIKSHDFASTYVGTPYYMSPEVCGNERYSMASDIWSLGCLIYELCTLSPPFNARSHIELFTKIKNGKYPPIPPVYSAELQKVISSCLQTNPNSRPDTSHFLNLPIVCVMRKQHEAVQIHRELQTKLQHVEKMKQSLKEDIDASLRREWEVKARLEIDRRVEEEKLHLNSIFQLELEKRIALALEQERSDSSSISGTTLGGSTTDETHHLLNKVTRLSLESPAVYNDHRILKRSAKTPLARAHTMVNPADLLASPNDVQMVDPSPMSIAGLALSPRKDANGNGTGNVNGNINTRLPGNIFTAKPEKGQNNRWKPTNASDFSPSASEDNMAAAFYNDSDAEDIISKSPSREPTKKAMAYVTQNTRKRVSLAHPEKPGTKRLISAPSLISQPISSTTSSLHPKRPVSTVPVVTTSPTRKVPDNSPSRTRGSKMLSDDLGSPVRKGANGLGFKSKLAGIVGSGPVRNVHGRTLVELAQARAGGPVIVTDKVSTKDIAVWDPERDEMPSPFLARGKKMVRSVY